MRTTGELDPRVGDVVQMAGLSNQALSRHFKSKDELLLAVLTDGQQRLLATLTARMARAEPGAPRVAAWIDGVVAQAQNPDAAENTRPFAINGARLADLFPDEWMQLREAVIAPLRTAVADAGGDPARDGDAVYHPAFAGWYVELGAGHVVTPTITINHRAVLAIAAVLPRGNGPCEVLTRIASFDLVRQQLVPATTGDHWQASLPLPVPVAAGFSLEAIDDAVTACVLGGQRIAACDVDTRPRKTWWRRNDAE
jgi:AcrR family transcriptional regulator